MIFQKWLAGLVDFSRRNALVVILVSAALAIFAGASAACVILNFSPVLVMKSTERSTFSLSAHSWQSLARTSFAPGTQWSQNPQASLPAAYAP